MLQLRCPACRAENSTPPNCRRCKADLSLMWGLESQRNAHVIAARQACDESRYDEALEELKLAESLRSGIDLDRFRACIFLLARDFDSAMEHRTIARQRASLG